LTPAQPDESTAIETRLELSLGQQREGTPTRLGQYRWDEQAGTTWAPIGQTPTVEATGRRFSLNMLSAVSGNGQSRFMVHEGSATAGVFVEFPKRLMH
jgi:hypothetical protein